MIEAGDIVLALAGKEKGGKFVVVKVDEKFVYLANGRRLVAAKPKRKSYKHVKMFCKAPDPTLLQNKSGIDAKIRKIIKEKEIANVEG